MLSSNSVLANDACACGVCIEIDLASLTIHGPSSVGVVVRGRVSLKRSIRLADCCAHRCEEAGEWGGGGEGGGARPKHHAGGGKGGRADVPGGGVHGAREPAVHARLRRPPPLRASVLRGRVGAALLPSLRYCPPTFVPPPRAPKTRRPVGGWWERGLTPIPSAGQCDARALMLRCLTVVFGPGHSVTLACPCLRRCL